MGSPWEHATASLPAFHRPCRLRCKLGDSIMKTTEAFESQVPRDVNVAGILQTSLMCRLDRWSTGFGM